jgi:hypothetical protein
VFFHHGFTQISTDFFLPQISQINADFFTIGLICANLSNLWCVFFSRQIYTDFFSPAHFADKRRFLISLKAVLAVGAASFARVVEASKPLLQKIQRTTRPKASTITKRSGVNGAGVWGTPKLPLKLQ